MPTATKSAKGKGKKKPPAKSLDQLIAEAKADVAKDSVAVRFAQGRVEHFAKAKTDHQRQRAAAIKHHRPKKATLYQGKIERDNRKLHLWTGNEATAIELNRGTKALLERLLQKQAALQPDGAHLVDVARHYIGTNEGGTLQRRWANSLGFSASLPWCSIFVANMLLEAGLITREQLPANPAYSGTWIGWPHGKRVNIADARPGDLLIFDWGDGGLTDHVAIYEGHGHHIGGNQSDQVNERLTPLSNVVAVIRVTG